MKDAIQFGSYRPSRRVAITRVAGQYIVCTYIAGVCTKRDYFDSRENTRAEAHAVSLRAS